MFGGLRALWHQTGITTSVEGVLREVRRGNAVEAQKWYFKLKKDSYKQAKEQGVTPQKAEDEALATVPEAILAEYLEVVEKLRRPGGIFAEIDDWLKTNPPLR
jgi:hypothetical protein